MSTRGLIIIVFSLLYLVTPIIAVNITMEDPNGYLWMDKDVDENATVKQNYPNTNFGIEDFLHVGWYGAGVEYRAYLKFKYLMIKIPVSSAILHIPCSEVSSGVTVQLWSVKNDSWTDKTITWNNMPDAETFLGEHDSEAIGDSSWNITDFVRSEVQTEDQTISLQFRTVIGKFGEAKYKSRQAKLSIVYGPGAPAPTGAAISMAMERGFFPILTGGGLALEVILATTFIDNLWKVNIKWRTDKKSKIQKITNLTTAIFAILLFTLIAIFLFRLMSLLPMLWIASVLATLIGIVLVGIILFLKRFLTKAYFST